MRIEPLVVLSLLLAGCSTVSDARDTASGASDGAVEGVVLDIALRPVVDAVVEVVGVGQAEVDEDGFYRIEQRWNATDHLVVAKAPGFRSATQSIAPGSGGQTFVRDFTLSRLPTDGYTSTQQHRGLIACGLIAQVGHSHGSGDPSEDNHVSCPTIGSEKQRITYTPERDPDDLLIELVWEANNPRAQFVTVVLRDDQDEVVAFAEGPSPLRLDVPQSHTRNTFADGRSAVIQLLPGIEEDNAAEVFVGLHLDQRFDIFATTSHGMGLPIHHTVLD